jgi:peptidoglycan/LPS O-acetylase OafA/YrhL
MTRGRAHSAPIPDPARRALARADQKGDAMTPADVYLRPRKRNFRLSPAVILTLAVVAALTLFARAPVGVPATPWETIVQKHYAPAAVIDGDGGQ